MSSTGTHVFTAGRHHSVHHYYHHGHSSGGGVSGLPPWWVWVLVIGLVVLAVWHHRRSS
ncbi:hypothetical protein [Streptomyces sp. NPDC007088]|uniref:hypothetical protein n=1 Tax=Streptomyces sp. NPDC007088 TaxID=3364773 RepID=UPI00369A1B84